LLTYHGQSSQHALTDLATYSQYKTRIIRDLGFAASWSCTKMKDAMSDPNLKCKTWAKPYFTD